MTQRADDLDAEFSAALRTGVPSTLFWQLARQSERPLADFADKFKELLGVCARLPMDALTAAAVESYRGLPGTKAARLHQTKQDFPMIPPTTLDRECIRPNRRLYPYFGKMPKQRSRNPK